MNLKGIGKNCWTFHRVQIVENCWNVFVESGRIVWLINWVRFGIFGKKVYVSNKFGKKIRKEREIYLKIKQNSVLFCNFSTFWKYSNPRIEDYQVITRITFMKWSQNCWNIIFLPQSFDIHKMLKFQIKLNFQMIIFQLLSMITKFISILSQSFDIHKFQIKLI